MSLPEAKHEPCRECPFRRASAAGWLGPYDADEWVQLVHSDEPIACHLTLGVSSPEDDDAWDRDGVKQCAGAASYRANVCKSPRDPSVAIGPADRENVFANPMEFKAHHGS